MKKTKKSILLEVSRKRTDLLTSSFLNSELQNYKVIHLYFLKIYLFESRLTTPVGMDVG